MSDAEYATGEASSQNWTMNGMRYCTSRYRTFNAEAHKPTASATASANAMNSGSTTIAGPGEIRYHAISASSTAKEIEKSTRVATTEASGTTRRGKYTLLIRPELPTMLLAEL